VVSGKQRSLTRSHWQTGLGQMLIFDAITPAPGAAYESRFVICVPQAKIQTVKKQIPVKKIAPDRTEELVKKHLGNIGEAEKAFKSVSALLEKHKTKYPELEQYIEHVSASDRSIQILEDIKDPRRAHYIFKILLTGVEPAYQVAHPGEKDHTNVDRAAWISTFEEALAKAIVQIVLSRQAEQASQAVGSPKE
jgi:hypothetical protein